MRILIGTDEAGYGPNYGPLAVAATAWEVAEEDSGARGQGSGTNVTLAEQGSPPSATLRRTQSATDTAPDLYHLLRSVVAKKSSERKIAIADSKALYAPGLGLRQLERGLHAVLGTTNRAAACWSEIVACCGADPDGHHRAICWPDGFDCRLPIDASVEELPRLAERLAGACEDAGVRPLLIRARMVFPTEFNTLVDKYGSKGAALSHVTVGLMRNVMDAASSLTSDLRPPKSTFAVCDKHGGRNFYTALLQHHFSEHWIEPMHESRAESRYEWGPPETRTCVTFRTNGERFLPTALASMTAKYLRELSMRAFNEFWCALVPGLRPTAGYPNDARRFREEIAAKQRELTIDDHVIWRNK